MIIPCVQLLAGFLFPYGTNRLAIILGEVASPNVSPPDSPMPVGLPPTSALRAARFSIDAASACSRNVRLRALQLALEWELRLPRLTAPRPAGSALAQVAIRGGRSAADARIQLKRSC